MRDINFFSYYQDKKQEKKDEKAYFYIAYGILALVILGTVMFSVVKIILLNNNIKDYNKKLSAVEIQSQLREADEISGKIEVLNKYETKLSDVANSVTKNDIVNDELLNDICGAIPSDVSFKDFKIEGYDVTINGVTHTRTAIGEFEHNLRGLSKIKDVQVVTIDKSNTVGEDYSFNMTCVLKEAK